MKPSSKPPHSPTSRPRREPRPAATVKGIVPADTDPVRARHIDPKWAGHYRALLSLRQALAADRAGEMSEVADPLEGHGMSLADTATDEFDHDMLLAELSAQQDHLYELDEAIRRIETHTYGTCELTGDPIPAERLRAVPWTRFTKEAEQELERLRAFGGPPHLGQLGSVRKPRQATLASAETVLEQREPTAADVEQLEKELSDESGGPFGADDNTRRGEEET